MNASYKLTENHMSSIDDVKAAIATLTDAVNGLEIPADPTQVVDVAAGESVEVVNTDAPATPAAIV